MRHCNGKSELIALRAAAHCHLSPGKKFLVVTGSPESKQRMKKRIAELSGGAWPINVQVIDVTEGYGS